MYIRRVVFDMDANRFAKVLGVARIYGGGTIGRGYVVDMRYSEGPN